MPAAAMPRDLHTVVIPCNERHGKVHFAGVSISARGIPDEGRLMKTIFYAMVIIPVCSILMPGCSGSTHARTYEIGSFGVQVSGTGLSVTDRYGRNILPGGTILFGQGTPSVTDQYGSFAITETAVWIQTLSLRVLTATTDQIVISVDTPSGTGYVDIAPAGATMLGISVTPPTGATVSGQPVNRTVLDFACGTGDHFYGLGEQFNSFDQRGNIVGIWAQDHGFLQDVPIASNFQAALHPTYFPEPFLLTSRPAGILVSSTAYSTFDLCASDPHRVRIELWDSRMHVFLISDADPVHIIRDFTGISGRQPLSPPWVIGPWISAELGEANVLGTADELRTNHVPSSAVWYQDWAGAVSSPNGYVTGHNWISDTALYPDMAGMNLTLNSMGFKALAYFNSFVNQDRSYYPVAAASGFLITQSAGVPYTFTGSLFTPESMLDVSNSNAASWMQGFMFTAVTLGFSGWMADFGEWLPYDTFMQTGSGSIMHNEYPVLWARLNYGLMSSAIPSGDFAFFMRSGYLGSQPYQPVIWAGDQNTDFDPQFGLPTVIDAALNLGVSGVPIVTHDIAGYATGISPSTPELYYRWTEIGCFTPVMRTHRGYDVFQNWNWDSDSATMQMFRTYAALHVELFPYIYTAMTEAHDNGTPIMQALWLQYYHDPKTAAIDDEYMFGDHILVAPVIVQGATTRTLYLPSGDWYPFNGGLALAGGVSVTALAPTDTIPVYVPAGSVIPMLTRAPDTLITGTTSGNITTLADVITAQTLRVYPGADGSFTVYDGSSFSLTSAAGGLNPENGLVLTDGTGQVLGQCASSDAGSVACGMISGTTFEVHGTGHGATLFTLQGTPADPATVYRIEVF